MSDAITNPAGERIWPPYCESNSWGEECDNDAVFDVTTVFTTAEDGRQFAERERLCQDCADKITYPVTFIVIRTPVAEGREPRFDPAVQA